MTIQQARNAASKSGQTDTAPISLNRILVCLDASAHAERALSESVRLAGSAEGTIIGIHAYAAKLHDRRFKQMEGGLPERYRVEEEMERQRDVHDSLITRGLGIISDSYHGKAKEICDEAQVSFEHKSPEGKNYRRIVEETNTGDYDVLALGALGLGAIKGSTIGTVCERVARRSKIDTLVIKDVDRAIGDGPIVVGLDGSARSYGALITAFELAERTGAKVHAVAAYDPFFHYVAFHKINDALTNEAAKVFKFKEQEKLHEEIIDSGIARIYQSHLDVAQTLAGETAVSLVTKLLEGKPFDVIAKYLVEHNASLLIVGKTGVHADKDLDIGGNAENLLRLSPCHVWLGHATHTPAFETIARETISWTVEATAKLDHVPETARAMVRMAILKLAQESGHTVITSEIMDEATRRFCPSAGGGMQAEKQLPWSDEARILLEKEGDPLVAASVKLRSEKSARRDNAKQIEAKHVAPFLEEGAAPAIHWSAVALARISRVPEMVRPSVRRRAESLAIDQGMSELDEELVEQAIKQGKEAMQQMMHSGGHPMQGKKNE